MGEMVYLFWREEAAAPLVPAVPVEPAPNALLRSVGCWTRRLF
jgi:hypothetical protein